jgi:hypothetical protein
LPPGGVKLLGRWTKADLSGGLDLLETEDPKKLIEFAYMWGDLMELSIFPVLDDQELSEALQNAMKKASPVGRSRAETARSPSSATSCNSCIATAMLDD